MRAPREKGLGGGIGYDSLAFFSGVNSCFTFLLQLCSDPGGRHKACSLQHRTRTWGITQISENLSQLAAL